MILSDGITDLSLPDDLLWQDEFWTPVEQALDWGLDGALFRQPSAKQAGRPITLAPPTDSAGWVSRETLQQLAAWAADPGLQLTLTFESADSSDVVFRHHEKPIDPLPVAGFSRRQPGEWWTVVIRLMEI